MFSFKIFSFNLFGMHSLLMFLSISGINVHDFKCNVCDKKFTTKRRYQYHMDSHSDVRTLFHCKYCDKSYTRSDNLSNHIKLCHYAVDKY